MGAPPSASLKRSRLDDIHQRPKVRATGEAMLATPHDWSEDKRPQLQPYLYYESPVSAVADAPRILLISHAFPPDPEVGGLRWQRMARFLGEQGWTFDVLTRDFRQSSRLDHVRLEELPPGTRVFCVPAGPPLVVRFQRAILMAWRRARTPRGQPGTGDPDGEAGERIERLRKPRALTRAYFAFVVFMREAKWAGAVARVGSRLISQGTYRAIISSGPPHMAHEGARRIARSSGLPYIVDMRDPWSLVQRVVEQIESPLWYVLARRYERRAVRNAALVVMNTERSRDAMRAAYPAHSSKIEVIRNGCDEEPLPVSLRGTRFSIRFAGSIYIDRDPRLVFRAAAGVIARLGLQPDQFAIEFIGDVDRYAGTPTMQIAREEGVERYVTLGGLLTRQAALEFLAGASVLLSLPQDSDFAIPAKIYEYLRFDAWMLVLAHKHSATAQLLRDVEADVFEPADVEGIARAIQRRYEQFTRGELPQAAGSSGRFDRRVQAEKLIRLIDGIVKRDFETSESGRAPATMQDQLLRS
jgi:glycosyltransferase involved in cell wall biosynthesis